VRRSCGPPPSDPCQRQRRDTRLSPPRHQSVPCPFTSHFLFLPTAKNNCTPPHIYPAAAAGCERNCHSSVNNPVATSHLNRTGSPKRANSTAYTIASSTNTAHSDRSRSIQHPPPITIITSNGKHLSGTRKHIIRTSSFRQPLLRPQVFRL